MKTPIITSENGDVCFFGSVLDAVSYLEPIDVLNGEYLVFDADGRLLSAIPTEPVVILVEPEKPSHNTDQLETILRSFFTSLGVNEGWVSSANLAELVSFGAKNYVAK